MSDLVIPAETVQRYDAVRRPWLRGDYVHRLLAGVRGQRVLELLCGDGTTAVLLALRGALVVGLDPSAEAIATARRRTEANGTAATATFEVASIPRDLGAVPAGSFDLIYAPMTLHRFRDRLSLLLPEIARIGRPGAMLVFVEPVSLWGWRRALRERIRPRPSTAPTPLDAADIAALRRAFPGLQVRYFGLFAALLQRAGFAPVYEKSNILERLTYDAAGIFDQFLFRVLRLEGLASSAVIEATTPSR